MSEICCGTWLKVARLYQLAAAKLLSHFSRVQLCATP